MKAVLGKLKKHWITIWLVAVTVLLGSLISYAIYTEVSSVKRVVTTKAAPKELFSSNCMYADLYERRMPANEYNVEVRNIDQNAPDVPNPSDIYYTLTAQLQVKYGNTIMTMDELKAELGDNTEAYAEYVEKAKSYTISKTQNDNSDGAIASPAALNFSDYASENYTIVFGAPEDYETLPGGSVSIDRFKVTVPRTDFDNEDPEFYIYVKADPTDTGLTDYIQTLLYGSKNIVVTASWSGALAEKNTSTVDYDFYNYIITGSGSGKLDIMWDPDWFEVNEFFFDRTLSGVTFDPGNIDGENIVIDTIDSGEYKDWNKVTIIVDTSGTSAKSRYELQLYKAKANVPYIGTDDAAGHIHCELQRTSGD